jgi:hypothetical protein
MESKSATPMSCVGAQTDRPGSETGGTG